MSYDSILQQQDFFSEILIPNFDNTSDYLQKSYLEYRNVLLLGENINLCLCIKSDNISKYVNELSFKVSFYCDNLEIWEKGDKTNKAIILFDEKNEKKNKNQNYNNVEIISEDVVLFQLTKKVSIPFQFLNKKILLKFEIFHKNQINFSYNTTSLIKEIYKEITVLEPISIINISNYKSKNNVNLISVKLRNNTSSNCFVDFSLIKSKFLDNTNVKRETNSNGNLISTSSIGVDLKLINCHILKEDSIIESISKYVNSKLDSEITNSCFRDVSNLECELVNNLQEEVLLPNEEYNIVLKFGVNNIDSLFDNIIETKLDSNYQKIPFFSNIKLMNKSRINFINDNNKILVIEKKNNDVIVKQKSYVDKYNEVVLTSMGIKDEVLITKENELNINLERKESKNNSTSFKFESIFGIFSNKKTENENEALEYAKIKPRGSIILNRIDNEITDYKNSSKMNKNDTKSNFNYKEINGFTSNIKIFINTNIMLTVKVEKIIDSFYVQVPIKWNLDFINEINVELTLKNLNVNLHESFEAIYNIQNNTSSALDLKLNILETSTDNSNVLNSNISQLVPDITSKLVGPIRSRENKFVSIFYLPMKSGFCNFPILELFDNVSGYGVNVNFDNKIFVNS